MRLTAVLAAASACLLSFAASAQDYPEMTLKYGSILAQGTAVSDVDEFFAKRVGELSNGKIKVDLYWTRSLGKKEEMIPLIEAGAVDFAMFETGQYTETPFMGFMNALPMVHFDPHEVVGTAKDLYANSDPIAQELKSIGARVVLVRHSPAYYLLCRKEFDSLASFKGARLRAYGAYVPAMWEAIGAIPVNVPSTELYEALDKGVIDCAYLPTPFHTSFKLNEVGKYLVDFSFGTIELGVILTPTVVWDSWAPEVQALFTQAAKDAEAFAITHISADEKAAISAMVDSGVTLVKIKDEEAFRSAIPDMLELFVKKNSAEGRGDEAQAVVDLVRSKTAAK